MGTERSSGFFLDVPRWNASRAVQRMSFAEEGVYFAMLREQWEHRSLPDDPQAVADHIATTPAKVAEVIAAWPVVRAKFVRAERGEPRIYNAALERTRRKQRDHRRKRQKAGALGGIAKSLSRRHDDQLEASKLVAMPDAPVANPTEEKRREETRRDVTRERDHASVSARESGTTNGTVADRAGAFIERYQDLYRQHRNGALYAVKPVRDYAAAVTLCQTWADDDRLDKLAAIFLTTDHKFAEEGSRTVPQFLALASWCDSRLAEWEAQKARRA